MRRPPVQPPPAWHGDVRIATVDAPLEGNLYIPPHARGLVLFAHGSGSGRQSPRNRHVAGILQESGLATLLFDLLTRDEERTDAYTAHLRFDIPFLAARLEAATRWAMDNPPSAALRSGYFGASTGAAAALIAATQPELDIGAVVSRGGRPDLAGNELEKVRVPTLLIVGGADDPVVTLNQFAYARLGGVKRLEIVPGATHLFEEPGTLDAAARLAADWFAEHLPTQGWHP